MRGFRWSEPKGLHKLIGMDVGFWIVMGAFVLAIAVFIAGWRLHSTVEVPGDEGSSEFPLERNQGDADASPYAPPQRGGGEGVPEHASEAQEGGRWKVSSAIYSRIDLPMMAFVAAIYCLPLLMEAFDAGTADSPEMELGVSVILQTMIFQGFMAALVVGFVAWRLSPGKWLGLKWRRWPLVLVIAPLGVVLTWGVVGVLQGLGMNEWLESMLGGDGKQEAVKAFTEEDDPLVVGLLAVTAVLVAPFTEELLFRGYLYPVAKRFIGRAPAIIFGALVFAVAHNNAMALIPLFVLAILMTLAYEFTGSIWAPIGMHVLFNGATVAAQLAFRNGWVEPPAI